MPDVAIAAQNLLPSMVENFTTAGPLVFGGFGLMIKIAISLS